MLAVCTRYFAMFKELQDCTRSMDTSRLITGLTNRARARRSFECMGCVHDLAQSLSGINMSRIGRLYKA